MSIPYEENFILAKGAVNPAGVAGPGFARVQTPAQLRAGEPAPQKAGASSNMKIKSIPKSGRVGQAVYFKGRYGYVVRQHVQPRDPRTPGQLEKRRNLVAVCNRWRTLTPEKREAWGIAAAEDDFVTEMGERVRLNGYNFFKRLNTRRADLGLPQFELPPAKPFFPPNPVAELVITNIGGTIRLKLRATDQPAQYTLVQGPAPKGSAVRLVQKYPLLGLLPPPKDGWSDITELYIARYGVPKVNKAIWIRTCQHIDGWIDVPEVRRARVRAPTD